jgi:hypothetical protein
MFESILIRPNSSRHYPMDYGQMIENLFFYERTIAHIDRAGIRTLFDLADVDVLEQLLRVPSLTLYYNNSHTAIIFEGDTLSVDSFGISDLDLEKELYEESFNYKGDSFRSKKFAKKISRLIKQYQLPKGFSSTLDEQLKDREFLEGAVLESIKHYDPELLLKNKEIRYELEYINNSSFKIHSNIDFSKTDKISADSPILALINACEDIKVMTETSSEISAPEFNSKMIRLKTVSAIERTNKSKKEIEVFNHFVYDEAWALREAINSKRIHVKPVLKVLQKAEKYKSWLKDLPNDANLMSEYVQRVEEKNIFESFYSKAIRFYLFNGMAAMLDVINPAIGVPVSLGLTAFDTFIFDHLCKKWKPNQFIRDELQPLVKTL